jgi:enterochelin esterase-like enzyme
MRNFFFASLVLLVLAYLAPVIALAQGAVRSPEVRPDNSVTFRLRAPNVKEVLLNLEGGRNQPMQKDEQGVWSLTTAPLAPDIYGYAFIVDGVTMFDPSNYLIKTNFIYRASMVHVPGPPSLPWEVNDVPHGVVHHHFYRSTVVGDQRDYYVYTPPGYEPGGKESYPTLYLLHGYSDDASGWTAVGRAHVIMDNLIAQGRAKPMIVVMPLGYGAPEILKPGGRFADLGRINAEKFRDALIKEVIPAVESAYRIKKGREDRAIAGLSMGGSEALLTGLNAMDLFAWVGSFSAGGGRADFDATFPELASKANERLRLLWIACGTEDGLITPNRAFVEWLKAKNIRHTWIETPGAHTWMVWRRNLAEFAPLLFR